MINITIPGKSEVRIEYLLLDYNGTLALDGLPLHGIKERLMEVSRFLRVHILTSDTHGSVTGEMKDLPASIHILNSKNHSREKERFIRELGAQNTIAIGNGINDQWMVNAAAIGIAVVQGEGASVKTMNNADLVFNNIFDALDCISHPKRLAASLRE